MLKNNFSLIDFCKRKGTLNAQVYDSSCLNDDGSIMSLADQAAVITHYLHLKGTPYEITYKDKALAFLSAWQKEYVFLIEKDNK